MRIAHAARRDLQVDHALPGLVEIGHDASCGDNRCRVGLRAQVPARGGFPGFSVEPFAAAAYQREDRAAGRPAVSPRRGRGVAARLLDHATHCNRKEKVMPAKSKAQQMAAGAALSAKRGDKSKSELKGASRSMASSMSEKELRAMASTKRKGKPSHASKSKS